MSRVLEQLVHPETTGDVNVAANRIKQAVQEIVLCALWRSGFFDHAVFHGGTCLRILHNLDRFSEDLDFTLDHKDPGFDFAPYAEAIVSAMHNAGVESTVSLHRPKGQMMVYSAKVKMNLKEAAKAAGFDRIADTMHSQKFLVVKVDVDLDPPEYFRDEVVSMSGVLDYKVRADVLPVLFAGKTAAVLCRHWNNRVKGRDLYDFRWYIESGIPIDMECLRSRMRKKCDQGVELDHDSLVTLLDTRFDTLDWDSAEEDVAAFIEPSQLGDWDAEHFKALARRLKVE